MIPDFHSRIQTHWAEHVRNPETLETNKCPSKTLVANRKGFLELPRQLKSSEVVSRLVNHDVDDAVLVFELYVFGCGKT